MSLSGFSVKEHSIFFCCTSSVVPFSLWAVSSSPTISHRDLCSSRNVQAKENLPSGFVLVSLNSWFPCSTIFFDIILAPGSVALLWWLMSELIITMLLLIAATLQYLLLGSYMNCLCLFEYTSLGLANSWDLQGFPVISGVKVPQEIRVFSALSPSLLSFLACGCWARNQVLCRCSHRSLQWICRFSPGCSVDVFLFDENSIMMFLLKLMMVTWFPLHFLLNVQEAWCTPAGLLLYLKSTASWVWAPLKGAVPA